MWILSKRRTHPSILSNTAPIDDAAYPCGRALPSTRLCGGRAATRTASGAAAYLHIRECCSTRTWLSGLWCSTRAPSHHRPGSCNSSPQAPPKDASQGSICGGRKRITRTLFFFFKSTCSQQRGIGRSPFPIRRVRFCRLDAFGLHAASVCSDFPIALSIGCFNTVAKIILPLLLYRQIHLRSRAEVFLCTASGDRKASKACQALGSFQTPALASRPPLCKDNIRSHRVARGNDAPGLRRSPALHSLTPS